MSDLYLQIGQRNARLRAWRACGLPVRGEWRGTPNTGFSILLSCAECDGAESFYVDPLTLLSSFDLPWLLRQGEREALSLLVKRSTCHHLAPLLLPEDPEEVRAVTALELLAGLA